MISKCSHRSNVGLPKGSWLSGILQSKLSDLEFLLVVVGRSDDEARNLTFHTCGSGDEEWIDMELLFSSLVIVHTKYSTIFLSEEVALKMKELIRM